MDFDSIAIFLAINALLYILIHLFLDLHMIKNRSLEQSNQRTNYPTWDDKMPLVKYVTVLTTLYFWAFFILWPILHVCELDSFFLTFSIKKLPVEVFIQIIGGALIVAGTLMAILGRIARGQESPSWGVPKALTTHGGFRLVRHPLYASYTYYFIGLPLLLKNPLLIPLIFGIYGYYAVAKYEEEILLIEFGEEYRKYQQKVGMLIPFIGKCKKSY